MRENKGKNVSLTPEHQAFVEAKVASGQYATVSDVVRDALRLLQREERRRLLEKWLVDGLTVEEESQLGRDRIAKARDMLGRWMEESLESGSAEPFDEAWMARLRAEVEARTSRRPAG